MSQKIPPATRGGKSHFYQIEGDEEEQESLLGSDSSVQSNKFRQKKLGYEEDQKLGGSTKDRRPPSIKATEAFQTAGLEEYFRPIDSYEGIHRWDPEYEWTCSEEKQVVRKVRDVKH